ncbi:MAG: nuclear transport factor 2 family protein [Chloroflexota bacterium]|nr:nuclear transport factor 2 family protein [Chloroflexota bacterium]
MNQADLQAWLDRYIDAWRANDRASIEALFSEDATYRWRPYGGDDRSATGREAIVEAWLDDVDAPGTWEAGYVPYAVDADRAVATGVSRYFATDDEPERIYHNVFLLRFDPDGRCTDFTELYMLEEGE